MAKIWENGVIREMTQEEVSALENEVANVNTKIQAEKTADATNKANGNQKLLDLGLTQAEATALTGYTPPVEE